MKSRMKRTAVVIALCSLGFFPNNFLAWGERIVIGEESDSNSEKLVARDVEEARRQAKLLHSAIHATLQIVHDKYYREDEGIPLPAGTLREVFAEIEKQQGVQLRWLAIDGEPMNVEHRPQNQFEKDAARALQRRKSDFEEVVENKLKWAGPITLSNHCQKCHVPNRKDTDDKTAGLIITIPFQQSR